MLQEPCSLLFDQLSYHIAEDCTNGVEPFIRSADVVQAVIVKEDLLDNEDGHRFAQLRARLHDSKAQRYDFRGQEEVDHVRRIVLDEGSNDTK